jgi:putative transposase
VIELPRSTFYYHQNGATPEVADSRLVELIGDNIQDDFPGYGYRRITHELRRRGVTINHKRISRVMKANGLEVKPRRRFVRTTDSEHDLPVFPNLYRNVIPARPNVVWVADITYIRLAAGFSATLQRSWTLAAAWSLAMPSRAISTRRWPWPH